MADTGEVLAVDGHGRESRAQINFKKSGIKWLALSVATLELAPN